MCGIAALWGDDEERLVGEMTARLAHRGPDGAGLHRAAEGRGWLGHRRLAIIDPAGGRQPIVSADGGAAVVHNGMIYNYRDLRARSGAEFRTASDSETLLHETGDGVTDLDGMFAFVRVEGDRLVAGRDPLGIKPLYMGRRGDALAFASEVKALAGIATDIREFPAGHVYRSDSGFECYYEVPDLAPERRGVGEVCAALRDTLERAVVKRLRSDVPLGAFLSGGLDSSIIAALARRHVTELHTFAVGLEGSPDLLAARRVAEHLGTVHHERLLTRAEAHEALPRILWHLESYDRDLVRSAVPCWFVAELAAERVKVVLTGEGADELFAGYRYYRGMGDDALLHAELRRSLASMHDINLQRVDRMTMAHGLEARVPFLDVAVVDLAMRIEPSLKMRAEDGSKVEKWILRRAFEDLLPEDITWRVKAQFDEGSGMAGLLAATVGRDDAVAPLEPAASRDGRSREERWYRRLLASQFDDARPVLDLVSHWSERPAGTAGRERAS